MTFDRTSRVQLLLAVAGGTGTGLLGLAGATWAHSAGAPLAVVVLAGAGACALAAAAIAGGLARRAELARQAETSASDHATESERLSAVAAELAALRQSFSSDHEALRDQTGQAIAGACERAVDHSARRAAEAVDAATSELRHVLGSSATSVGDAARHLERAVAEIERRMSARTGEDTDAAERVAGLVERVNTLVDERSGAEIARAEKLDALADAVAARLEKDLDGRRTADAARMRAFDDYARTLSARADEDLQARRELVADLSSALSDTGEQLQRRWERATEALERVMGDAADNDARRSAELLETTAGIRDDLRQAAGALRERVATDEAAARERDQRIAEAIEAIGSTADALRESAREQAGAAHELTEAADARAEAVANRSAEHAAAFARQMITTVERHQERIDAFERQLLEMHRSAFAAAGETLRDYARELVETTASTVEATGDASDAVRAGGAELAAAAEMFAESVHRHRDAANLWLESLGAMESAIERAGEHAAADALGEQLASTQELFTQQLELHRELYEQMRTMREAPAAPVDTDPPTEEEERATA